MESIGSWGPAAMQGAGTLLSAQGTQSQGTAYQISGERAQQSANFEADQLEQNAGQQIAASQRAAYEERLNARIVASRALAVAAASGGGASDPTVVDLLAKIAGEGTYRSMSRLYQGEENARVMKMQAEATRYSGKTKALDYETAARAKKMEASNTLLSGATTLFSNYGIKGSKNTTSMNSGAGLQGWVDT